MPISGIEFVEAGPDWLAARMPVDRRTVQPHGRLHGGASVVLAETVASVAGMLTLNGTCETAVGMEINANHLLPVASDFVTATARPEGDSARRSFGRSALPMRSAS